jgi:hypothetical protein
MRTLWVVSWLLIVLTLIALGLDVFGPLKQLTPQLPPFVISAGSALLFSIFHLVFYLYIGDAARYLSPIPDNIKLRQTIRADGIQLLRKIHESGEYERVIVVGHSLGSVVAYDILKHLWQEYYTDYRQPKTSSQPALARLEKIGEDLERRRGCDGGGLHAGPGGALEGNEKPRKSLAGDRFDHRWQSADPRGDAACQ